MKAHLSVTNHGVIEKIILAVLLGQLGIMLLIAPLAFGSVQYWSQEGVFLLAVTMATCLVGYLTFSTGRCLVWTWAYVPIVLFFGLLLLQTVNLPVSWLSWISPQTVHIKHDLIQDIHADTSPPAYETLSFYLAPTIHQTYLILILVVVFLTTLHVCGSPKGIKAALCLMCVSGILVALTALYQNLSGSGTFLGLAPMRFNSGPFAAHSHFGQFMNLSIGGTLALWLIDIRESGVSGSGSRPASRYIAVPRRFSTWLFLLAMGLSITVIALSATRGGLVAAAVASMTAMSAIGIRYWGVGRVTPWLLASGLVLVIFCGAVTLSKQETPGVYREGQSSSASWRLAEGGRLEIIRDSLPAIESFPLLGTGLGTFEYVFPMYDRSNRSSLAAHADNDYVQLLFETGLVGVVIVSGFLGIIIWHAWRTIRSGAHEPVAYALYGLVYGTVAVLVHSLVDFGQHVPGVAVMTAVSFALIINISRICCSGIPSRRPIRATRRTAGTKTAMIRLAAGVACLALGGLVAFDGIIYFDLHRRAEQSWQVAQRRLRALERRGGPEDDAGYARVLIPMAHAVELVPEDVKYRTTLNDWRWASITRADADTVVADELKEAGQGDAQQIAEDLEKVILTCPTYGPAHSLAGRIRWVGLEQTEGRQLILRGAELTGHDAYACFEAGRIYAESGDRASAETWFERAMTRRPRLRHRIIDLLERDLDEPRLAYVFAKDDPVSVVRLIQNTMGDPRYTALAHEWLDQSRDMVIRAAARDDASPSSLAARAQLHWIEGDLILAAAWYRKALDRNDLQPAWHLKLARVLTELGEFKEAEKHASRCIQVQPYQDRARTLLTELASLDRRRAKSP